VVPPVTLTERIVAVLTDKGLTEAVNELTTSWEDPVEFTTREREEVADCCGDDESVT
jgi:hypothetical protein